MYNLRYHVASLVAAFLFLTVGLLLGTIVAERGTLDTQRDTLISSLRDQFEQLSAQNTALSTQNDALGSFVDDVLPLLTAGQLAGDHVVVISNTGRTDGLSLVAETITRAGGTPVVITAHGPQLGLADSEASQVATAYVDVSPADETAFIGEVTARLAEEWSSGGDRPLTDALVSVGALTVDGEFPVGEPIAGVVTLASWEGVPDEAALGVARALALMGMPAAGVEMSTQATGVAASAAGNGLSAVEDVGTPQSDFALVYVLAGRASGYFGVSDDANARYPVVEAEVQQP